MYTNVDNYGNDYTESDEYNNSYDAYFASTSVYGGFDLMYMGYNAWTADI